MIKDFLLARVAADVPPEELRQQLLKHATLSMSVPALAHEMRRYTMNNVSDGSVETPALYEALPGLVTIVEHDMGGEKGIARFEKDERYLSIVRPHEQYMSQHVMAGAPQLVAVEKECPVFTSDDPFVYRVFDLVRRPASVSRDRFVKQLASDGAWATQDEAYRAAVARRVHSLAGSDTASYGGEGEPFDAVIETWISAPDRLAACVDEQRRRRADFCDPDRSFTAVTQELWIYGRSDAFGPRTQA